MPVAVTCCGRAEHEVGEGDGVDAEVEQRAAREVGLRQPGRAVGVEALPVVGEDGDDVADEPGLDDVAHDVVVRQEAAPHRLHDEQAPCLRGEHHLARLGGVAREGLLDEHGLARLEGEQGVVAVLRVRRRDVDGVDLVVGHELLVAAVCRVDPELVGEVARPLAAARADRDDLRRRADGDRLGEGVGDAARADDPPADRRGVVRVGRARLRQLEGHLDR